MIDYIGDTVCITRNIPGFTFGRVYEPYNYAFGILCVVDDTRNVRMYYREFFISIDEWCDIKLKEVLGG